MYTYLYIPPKYLNIDLITCKVLGFLNLHRIYRNLHKFTPLFEKFTKIYVIYSVNCLWHPAPYPLFPGLLLFHESILRNFTRLQSLRFAAYYGYDALVLTSFWSTLNLGKCGVVLKGQLPHSAGKQSVK